MQPPWTALSVDFKKNGAAPAALDQGTSKFEIELKSAKQSW
jgi:hypothetical protein